MIPLDILFLTGLAVLPSGVLCGLTSIFIYRLRMLTIGFSVAHGALAGAALSMLLQLDPLTLSFLFAFLTALILGPLADILRVPLDLVSMTVFSLHSISTTVHLSNTRNSVSSSSSFEYTLG